MAIEFKAWPKTPRLDKALYCTITEKLDGTNAQIVIEDGKIVAVGSRNRYITPQSDNFGFAGWVSRHEEELLGLGDGTHYGEWYGSGIQRTYGLKEKKFALFNAPRWSKPDSGKPECVEVVPILYYGSFSQDIVDLSMAMLKEKGSQMVEGFMNPEGIVINIMNQNIKVTYEHSEGKWKDNAPSS